MTPTRIAALRAMARADESPQEAQIARTKLAEAGVPIDPPSPPAPPAAPAPQPFGFGFGRVIVTTSFGDSGNTAWTTTGWVRTR